jgi:hypothetical protein
MTVIASRIEEQYLPFIRDLWESFGHEIKTITITAPPRALKTA